MKKQLQSRKKWSTLFYSFCFMLLFANTTKVQAQTATNGDFRSAATGNWGTLATWQTRTGGDWATATALPTASNNVYIQNGHTVTVDASVPSGIALCNDLHIAAIVSPATKGVLSIGAYNVNVSGKLREYSATAVTTTGFGDTTFYSAQAINANTQSGMIATGTGTLTFVGGTRNITNTNEWGTAGSMGNIVFTLDTDAVGTLTTGIKGSTITINNGSTITTGVTISSAASPSGVITIMNGAKFISSRTGNTAGGGVFSSATNAITGTVNINAGGILELTGAAPAMACATFNNNGTVIYSAAAAQTLLQPSLLGTGIIPVAPLNSYSTLILAGSSAKTPFAPITVSSMLQLIESANIKPDATNTLTMLNNSIVERGGSVGTPIPSTAGAVFYGAASTDLVNVMISYTGSALNLSNETPPSPTPGKIGSLMVNSGVTYNLTAGRTTIDLVNNGTINLVNALNFTINGSISGSGAITIPNNANLIQTKTGVDTNSGTVNITLNRDSNPLYRLDYTMWSSPVTNAAKYLTDFSPLTSNVAPNNIRFYNYDPVSYKYVAITTASSTPFASGTGYLIRMPNTDPTPNYDDGLASLTYPGVFTGVPNNGNVAITVTAATYNAVGNPYPSNISADAFINGNTTAGGTLYFWRKTNNLNQATVPTTSYATYTLAGGVGTGPGSGGITPNGTIAVGQGFIINSRTATSINFDNTMRSTNTALFLKTKAPAQKDRVWITLSQGTDVVNQMMVAYMDGSTQGVDNGIDGKYINDAATALTSNIDGGEYVIQGRPAFDVSDVVDLNFKAENAGTFTIAKDSADGLFASGQDVFLVDATTGTETNLQTDAYTFTASAGVSNSRFKLTYKTTGSLKVIDQAIDANSISVYKQNGVLNINSGTTTMKNVKVFDVTGRLLLEQNAVNANSISLKNLAVGKQAVLIQITSDDNKVVTKKAIN